MTTINDLDQINAEAMMTLSKIGYAAYEKYFCEVTAGNAGMGSMASLKLKSWICDRAATEEDLSLRIKCAPMYKPMA